MIYLITKKMTFEEENNEIEHEIILRIFDKEIYGYDYCLDIEWDINIPIRAEGWNSFPLYELKDGKIISFDYNKYKYFKNVGRRDFLANKIRELYNPSSEAKILRKTLKYIMDTLKIEYPDFFKKYNDKVEAIINNNPKGEK